MIANRYYYIRNGQVKCRMRTDRRMIRYVGNRK